VKSAKGTIAGSSTATLAYFAFLFLTIHLASRCIVFLLHTSALPDKAAALALLFIDGGHGTQPAHLDYEGWMPQVAQGGTVLIHDVFEDPADGGRPPYEIWTRAIGSGAFAEVDAVGSLRVLVRTGPGI
jgi:hypothetical protein